MEENYRKLESRVTWLNKGYANTKFFHTLTFIKRRKNRIIFLKTDNEDIHEQADIINCTFLLFNNLIHSNHHKSIWVTLAIRKNFLSKNEKSDLQ